MLDVSAAINATTGGMVSLVRQGGSWVRGKWVASPQAPETIMASLQPVSGREFQNLPEGIRNEAQAVIYTATPLKEDDEIADGGKRYKILSLDDWQDRGGYTKAVLGLLKAST